MRNNASNTTILNLADLEKKAITKLKTIELLKIRGGDCGGCDVFPSAVGIFAGKPKEDDPG